MYFLSFISLLLLVFFIDEHTGDDTNILASKGILAVVIALSLAFGFFLLVCLLGYALVKIPISFWISSNYKNNLDRLLFKIAVYEEKIID